MHFFHYCLIYSYHPSLPELLDLEVEENIPLLECVAFDDDEDEEEDICNDEFKGREVLLLLLLKLPELIFVVLPVEPELIGLVVVLPLPLVLLVLLVVFLFFVLSIPFPVSAL